MSDPGCTGVLVAVGVALGSVAVCDVAPTEINAMTEPSLIIRRLPPTDGRAVLALAVVVTEIGSVLHCAENGFMFCIIYLSVWQQASGRVAFAMAEQAFSPHPC